jgi:hypothetical protein
MELHLHRTSAQEPLELHACKRAICEYEPPLSLTAAKCTRQPRNVQGPIDTRGLIIAYLHTTPVDGDNGSCAERPGYESRKFRFPPSILWNIL